MADRDPWIKFRPDYWLNDLELRSCSPTAKAAVVDLMCIMHASRLYGHLLVNGTQPDLKAVGKWFGWRPDTFRKAVEEALQKGALRRNEWGVIYSQRMVSDWEEREEMRRRGKLGGNPSLDKQEVNQGSEKVVKADKNKNKNKNRDKKKNKANQLNPDFEIWWEKYPRKEGKVPARTCYEKIDATPQQLLDSVRGYVKALSDNGTEKKYIMQPAKFLGPDEWWRDYGEAGKEIRRQSENRKEAEIARKERVRQEQESKPPLNPEEVAKANEQAAKFKEQARQIASARSIT